ncbi:MAG TPA: hypothetical protein PKD85_17475 [Saprospiraceae bacterium]|nr:hypothetical protein [Saprospiraceae bacterium]
MKYLSILLLYIISSSCAVYAPNSLNVTGFSDRGQIALSANAGNGINLQAAYALTNNIGAMVNYMNTNQIVESDGVKRDGSGNLLEAGLGYFKNTKDNFRMEVFAGYGQGSVNITKTNADTRNFSTNANRLFLQPSIGYAHTNFEVFFSTRLANVNFNSINTTYTPQDLEADSFVKIDEQAWLFLEPAVTLRAGIRNVKLQLQVGRSIKLKSDKLGYDSGLVNIGAFAKF